MDRSTFTKLLEKSHARELKLNGTKGKDYAGDEDALRNFKEAAAELGLTPEKVLGVYLHKHYSAIRTYIETGAVSSEGIEGRIDDARLYLALLEGLVVEKQDKPTRRPRRTKAEIEAERVAKELADTGTEPAAA